MEERQVFDNENRDVPVPGWRNVVESQPEIVCRAGRQRGGAYGFGFDKRLTSSDQIQRYLFGLGRIVRAAGKEHSDGDGSDGSIPPIRHRAIDIRQLIPGEIAGLR